MPRAAAAAAPQPLPTANPTFISIDDFALRVGLQPSEVVQTAVRLGVQVYELGTSTRLPPVSQIAVLHEVVNDLRAAAKRPVAVAQAHSQLADLRTDVAALIAEVAASRRGTDALADLFRQALSKATEQPPVQEIK